MGKQEQKKKKKSKGADLEKKIRPWHVELLVLEVLRSSYWPGAHFGFESEVSSGGSGGRLYHRWLP